MYAYMENETLNDFFSLIVLTNGLPESQLIYSAPDMYTCLIGVSEK